MARANCPKKKIRAWSPASWAPGASREKRTVEQLSALVVDLDHVPPAELEVLLGRLSVYSYILHSSHSDRDNDRCVRLVIQLSRPVLGAEFPGFWLAAINALGLPADASAKDASRLYYLPSRPSDACDDVFDGNGFDYAVNTGKPFDVPSVPIAPRRELLPGTIPSFHGAPSSETLSQAVRVLGEAWPSTGRHQAQLALAGALARAGWPVSLVAEFCAAVAEVEKPGNGDLPKRLAAAQSSADKLAVGEDVSGWPTVGQHVSPVAVESAMHLLGLAIVPDPEFAATMTSAVQHRPTTTRLELRAAIEHARDRLKKSDRLSAQLLTKILKIEPLTEHGDEDREKALVQAAIALVRAAPPGTQPALLCEFLLTPAGRLAGDVEEVVKLAIKHVANLPPPVEEAEPPDDDALRAQLELDKDGRVRGAGANIERVIRFGHDIRGRIRFNLITKQVEITNGRFAPETPSGLPVGIKNWLGSHWQLTTSTMEVADQLLRVAQRWCAYDPVVEYLRGLTWDRISRVDSWLTRYCGVEPTPYASKVGAKFLISACARALNPGCKVDTVLVLEGDQGVRKSTTLGILGGAWFTDTPMVLGDKDSRLLAACKWIVELGELKSLLRDDDAAKGFLSQRYDDFRPPYGRAPEQFLRRCVFAGSTNEHEYLQDATGNRRYWAVKTGRCNTEALARDRDQIWAEATFRYLSAEVNPDQADPACPGERWWFPDEEQSEADEVIADRRTEDPWVQMITSWTDFQMRPLGTQPPKTQFTMTEIAEHALKLSSADAQRYNKKISQVMRAAGFTSVREGQGRRRIWVRPGATASPPVLENSSAQQLLASN